MINKSHAKYQEYISKCEELADLQEKELSSVKMTYGFDGPTTAIYKKYAKKLKELQKEYSFLFTEN